MLQEPEEVRNVRRPKRCDKHGDKDEDNSLKNVNNVYIYIYIYMTSPSNGRNKFIIEYSY